MQNQIQLILRGGGHICPPYDFQEKKFFAQFLLHTQTTTQNRVTHQKPGLYLEKQKNGGRFKIAVCNMTRRISSIFCIFYLFALKWLSWAIFGARPLQESKSGGGKNLEEIELYLPVLIFPGFTLNCLFFHTPLGTIIVQNIHPWGDCDR